MAFCSLEKKDMPLGITPVENLYIQEYMTIAPGDYVKVYLYGLMQAYYPECAEESLARFAKALGMEEQAVLDALHYWQRNGLVKVEKEGCVFLSAKGSVFGGASAREHTLYRYSEMNAQITELLGSRSLKQNEWRQLYDWVEVFGLSEEAVVMLVQYGADKMGKRVAFSYLAATARDWAAKDVKTPEKAREYVSTFHLSRTDANRVSAHLGFSRRVSQEEYGLYEKWTQQWGFDLDGVLAACARTTLSANPTFAYLDKILQTNRKQGLLTAEAIKNAYAREDSVKDRLTECARALGARVSQSAGSYYDQWLEEYGLSHDAVLLVLQEAAQNGVTSFKDADALMGSYARRGKLTKAEIGAEQRHQRKAEGNYSRIAQDLGVKSLSAADKRMLDGWIQSLPLELILQGAEYAAAADRPVLYLNKVLLEWRQKGILTAAAARQEHSLHADAARERDSGPRPARRKSRRQSVPPLADQPTSELDGLFETLGSGDANEDV